MNKKIIISIVIITMLLSACKKEITPAYQDKPIVESYLSNGDTLSVKVSRQVPFSTESATYSKDDINNLNITVTFNNNQYLLSPMGSGLYKAISPLLIVNENNKYDLSFDFNNSTVTASTTIPIKPNNYTQSVTSIAIPQMTGTPPSGGTMPTFPDPVKLTWTNTDNSYYLVVIQCIESDPVSINDIGSDGPPAMIFRNKPSQSSGYEISSRNFNYYGAHRLILFHLNPDYASLYDDAGTSSQNLTNPSTSITNGLGIFTGVNSDTLLINVTKQ